MSPTKKSDPEPEPEPESKDEPDTNAPDAEPLVPAREPDPADASRPFPRIDQI